MEKFLSKHIICFLEIVDNPVSLATHKRYILKLKLINNYFRFSMLKKRLNEFTILSVEIDVVEILDYMYLMDDFAEKC